MTPDTAIDIMARSGLWIQHERLTEEGGWEDYPDLNERDYENIIRRMADLLPTDATLDQIGEAHAVLSARTTDE